jgi:dienelactone hydrolase
MARPGGSRPSFDDGRSLAGAEARVEILFAPIVSAFICVICGFSWGGRATFAFFVVENASPGVLVVSRG